MIIVKLKGGLGNQLFQYSFGRYLDKNFETKVKYDLNWFKKDSFNFELEKLGFDIDRCNITDYIKTLGLFLHPKIARKLGNKLSIDTGFIEESSQFQIKKNGYYDGYWQDYNFVKRNLNFLKEHVFKARDSFSMDFTQPTTYPTVAVHIRGGDYFKSKNHVVLGEDYYRKAIDKLLERYGNLKLFIFTNDIQYAKRILIKLKCENYKIISGTDPTLDFLKMTTCDHYIIANSTYSWWGAVIGENENSLIVAPSKWSQNNKNQFIDNNILSNWELI